MAIEITMPQLSDTMNEGKILTWRKKEGERVSRGEALAEVATDKADLEIESFHEGVLLKINAPEGSTVKVGTVIAVLGEAGEAVSAPKDEGATATESAPPPKEDQVLTPPTASYEGPEAAPQTAAEPQLQAKAPEGVRPPDERIKISPLARNVAQSQGVDYKAITGSGEGGRIVRRDIESAVAARGEARPAPGDQTPTGAPPARRPFIPEAAPASRTSQPLSRMRQTIANRMVESVTTIPHFYVTSKILADELIKMRKSLQPLPQYEGITYNHFIIKACAAALRAVPAVNNFFDNGSVIQPGAVNIGIVTAVPDGLLIPVVKDTDRLPLSDIVFESRGLVQRARAGRPKSDDLVGGTFSISNMGMFAVESFTAIISPGQGGILAISAINEEPVVKNGAIVPGAVMRVTLSVDHRIIDGVVGGEFVTELKRLLEDPVLLLA